MIGLGRWRNARASTHSGSSVSDGTIVISCEAGTPPGRGLVSSPNASGDSSASGSLSSPGVSTVGVFVGGGVSSADSGAGVLPLPLLLSGAITTKVSNSSARYFDSKTGSNPYPTSAQTSPLHKTGSYKKAFPHPSHKRYLQQTRIQFFSRNSSVVHFIPPFGWRDDSALSDNTRGPIAIHHIVLKTTIFVDALNELGDVAVSSSHLGTRGRVEKRLKILL